MQGDSRKAPDHSATPIPVTDREGFLYADSVTAPGLLIVGLVDVAALLARPCEEVDREILAALKTLVGRHPGSQLGTEGWADLAERYWPETAAFLRKRGSVPVMRWGPW